MQKKYTPSEIEAKWRKVWDDKEIYKFKEDPNKKIYYPLVELPYPSGDLHIGHWFSFGTADVHARVHRMMGENVFFTNGYDAFGLPAENAAIKRGVHPQDWTMKNIETMTTQFATMGSMIDWSHTTAACLPEYYAWNQWIFIRMYEKGLAYRGKMLSNWCPIDQTVLANEHVENGKCWRCGNEVVQKEVEQWFIKLTALADELIWPNPTETVTLSRHSELVSESDKKILNRVQDDKLKPTASTVDWPVSVKVAQNQWIGKKEGVKIKHHVVDMDLTFESFSAYPAWSWADSYIVIAPEHPLIKELVTGTKQESEVMEFVEQMAKQTELERQESKEKLGVFTGRYAKDPFGGPDMPIWLANFALLNFGTGIIRCSGHDERDIEFAKKYGIQIKETVDKRPNGQPATPHDGIMNGTLHDSGPFTGRDVWEVVSEVIDWIEKQGIGKRYINYHIHDWSISRQRYWGTPVPMIHCEKDGIVPVPDDQLPVTLPYDVDYQPKGKAPLASNEEWMKVTCPKCGGQAQRDPETLDTFFDSSWYFWRYLDPHYTKGPFDADLAKKIMPVDVYFGGAEHTLGHTLYARFFTKFFKMLGLTDLEEFAWKRVQHGVILGPDGHRMSKSKGNVVNPDDVVKEYGADATRLYLCFMMPYDATAPWDTNGVWGVYRFLKRVWDLQEKVTEGHPEQSEGSNSLTKKDKVIMNKTIKKVGEDAGGTKFNTAVAELMKWINHLESKEVVTTEEYKNFLLILAPFAPHMTEELWQSLFVQGPVSRHPRSTASVDDLPAGAQRGAPTPATLHFESIHQQFWPKVDSAFLTEDMTTIVVQVNGKMRGSVEISTEFVQDREKVIAEAQSRENITKHLEGKTAKNIIYVPGKILNFVI